MSTHTPGPWFTSRPHGTIYIEARLRGSTLQEVAAVGPTETPEQQEANARLIAAAPDLLFELEGLVHFSDGFGLYGEGPAAVELRKWVEGARTAIAKATGVEP